MVNIKTRSTSSSTAKRLRIQGYGNRSDAQLLKLAFGNRFAYIICSMLVSFGVLTANIWALSAMMPRPNTTLGD